MRTFIKPYNTVKKKNTEGGLMRTGRVGLEARGDDECQQAAWRVSWNVARVNRVVGRWPTMK